MTAELARETLCSDIRRAAAGDPSAVKAIYDATSAKLFGVCLRILKDRSEAEDVLQEVYLTVWSKADQFDPRKASPITWLVAMARHRSIDRQRVIGRRAGDIVSEAIGVADETESALDSVMRSDDTRRLQACLAELEPQHHRALRTTFYEGRTYDDAAEVFGVPSGTMKSWIRRALMKLKECLDR